jgi:para-nitrobenzyl esterase
MTTTRARRLRRAALLAVPVISAAAALLSSGTGAVASLAPASAGPVVRLDGGLVRGTASAGVASFLGLPYAAPPTGNLRWRPPQPAAGWTGVKDATAFGPSCPQATMFNPFLPPGPISEDCLYLNVYTPALQNHGDGRPVLVWIHGGGLVQDGARNYDGTKLAADGIVVVTINYRLGALGFLAHPALASAPGGPSGNYGHMDQQAALRWVQRNIRRFGGDPDNVTIAGQSAGALSVLVHLVSDGSRGLFHRAIVQSGSFALTQLSLAQGEAFGQAFAAKAGCSNQTAACLRNLPVSTLLDPNNFPGAAIPGIVDGKVLKESLGTALAAGRFARVPVINGVNHDEQRLFVTVLGLTVTGGSFVPLLERPITPENYQRNIAFVLGASDARAASIAAEYPIDAYSSPEIAFSTLDNDASWACPALQMEGWLAKRVPTFAYEFNDDNPPPRYFPPLGVATHGNELPYIFDQPNAPIQAPFSPASEALAASMRAAWASFAATGDPASKSDVRWPSFGGSSQQRVLSLATPASVVIRDFASRHHCSFWTAD